MKRIMIVDKKMFKNLPFGRSIINVKKGYRFVIILIGEIEVEFREIEFVDMIRTDVAFVGAAPAARTVVAKVAVLQNQIACAFGGLDVAAERLEIECHKMEPLLFEDNMFHVKQPGITKEQRSIWRNNDKKKRWRK